MTTTIKGNAPMNCELEFITDSDNPAEHLINLAEELSGGLDSHDLGDAMGFFNFQAMMNGMEYEVIREDCTLRVAIIFDLFKWEGI